MLIATLAVSDRANGGCSKESSSEHDEVSSSSSKRIGGSTVFGAATLASYVSALRWQ